MEDTRIKQILHLISLKQEGAYWDFKKEWHSQKSDLLHDIMCFANNLVNSDCYIIIGVDEENDYAVCDIKADLNRKNTQKLVDFLKDKKFAGGVRPLALVESRDIDGKTIDVIIIKNSFDTPYYLTESYQDVYKNNIYARVMDTNTPKPNSADVNYVEYLWKKRFRLLETPLERFYYFLHFPIDWSDSPFEYTETKFYKYAPEYRIVSTEDESRDGYEYYLFSQSDPRPHWYNTSLFYHQTVIEAFLEMAMDGGRWSAIAPERSAIYKDGNRFSDIKSYYGYYIKDSLRYTLHTFLGGEHKAPYDYQQYMEVILLFSNVDEKNKFESYVIDNMDEFDQLFSEQKAPYMEPVSNYVMSAFEKDYKASLALQIMLFKFREAQ